MHVIKLMKHFAAQNKFSPVSLSMTWLEYSVSLSKAENIFNFKIFIIFFFYFGGKIQSNTVT